MNGGFAPVYTREASAFAGAFCMKSGHLWGTERCLKNGRTQEIRPQGRHGGTAIRYLFRGHGGERKALHAGVLPPQHPMPHPAASGRARGGGTDGGGGQQLHPAVTGGLFAQAGARNRWPSAADRGHGRCGLRRGCDAAEGAAEGRGGVHRAGTEADGTGHPAPPGQDGTGRAADSLHRVAAGRAVRPAMAGRGRRRGTAAHPADGGAHRADRRRDVPDGAATENGKF